MGYTHDHLLDYFVAGMRFKRITKEQLARRCGISLRTVHRIYAGEPTSEKTWDKLFAAVMNESGEES